MKDSKFYKGVTIVLLIFIAIWLYIQHNKQCCTISAKQSSYDSCKNEGLRMSPVSTEGIFKPLTIKPVTIDDLLEGQIPFKSINPNMDYPIYLQSQGKGYTSVNAPSLFYFVEYFMGGEK